MCTWMSAMTLGGREMKRSNETYKDLGLEADKKIPERISFKPGEVAAVLGLYLRESPFTLIGISGEGH